MFNRSFLRRRKVSQLPQSILQYSAAATNDYFGWSVALSSDGTTAIVGANGDNSYQGSATVFTRSGVTWTQQQNITQTGGAASDSFGYSVALSADGNTAICGVPYGGAADTGAAVVFTRSGATWTEEAALTYSAAAADDLLGFSVALSSDGNTAIVGAPTDNVGAIANQGSATVYTRSGGVWTEQQTITQSTGAAGDEFGFSVALSSDGNTAIVGARGDNNQGSATVFTRSGVTWTQQQTITQSTGAAGDQFGWSIALSADGNTAIVGAYADDGVGLNTNQGSATVFTRSGSTWTQQQTITQTGGAADDGFGSSVALSSSGDIALVGVAFANIAAISNSGAVVMFARNNGTWVQQSVLSYLGATSNSRLGLSAALSTDGNIAIAGAPGIGADVGGAIVFYNH
jgi:hypothetical protein